MTPEAQRIAIAKACGWEDIHRRTHSFRRDPQGAFLAGTEPHTHHGGAYEIAALPDYLNDLNAMHEAEKVLTSAQCYDYQHHLADILGPWKPRERAYMWLWHATAAQRAEAFTVTLELREDES